MHENQRTISEWAVKTFGYATRERSIERMMEEVEELRTTNIDNFEDITNECADVLITLCQVATVFGFNLQSAFEHKMSINRARKWNIAGDGTGQHIKE